jgi:HEAT repeat protein
MSEFHELLKRLKQKTGKENRDAIIAEMSAMGEDVIPLVIESIRNNEEPYALGEVLTEIGKASTLPLIELFFDYLGENKWIERAVDDALKALHDERVIQPMLDVFERGDEKRVVRAMNILAKINDDSVVPKMIAFLSDANTSEKVKGAAITLLGCLNAIEACDLIASFFKNEALHLSTAIALYRLRDGRSIQPFKNKLLDEEAEPVVHTVIALLIGEYPNAEFVPILVNLLSRLVQTYQHDHTVGSNTAYTSLVWTLIKTLGKSKDDRAVDILMQIVRMGALGMGKSVLGAVAEIGSDYAIEQLINLLAEGFRYWDEYGVGRNQVADTLTSFGEKIVPHLKKIVEDKTDDIQRRRVASGILLRISMDYIYFL